MLRGQARRRSSGSAVASSTSRYPQIACCSSHSRHSGRRRCAQPARGRRGSRPPPARDTNPAGRRDRWHTAVECRGWRRRRARQTNSPDRYRCSCPTSPKTRWTLRQRRRSSSGLKIHHKGEEQDLGELLARELLHHRAEPLVALSFRTARGEDHDIAIWVSRAHVARVPRRVHGSSTEPPPCVRARGQDRLARRPQPSS